MGPHQHARRIRFFRGKIARRTWNPPPEISRMKLRQIREAQKRKNKNNISQMRERLCRLTYLYADGPDRARVDPKTTSRFALAQTLNHYRVARPPIQFHSLHPPPFAPKCKGLSLTEFCSGATRLSGRFSEGLLLRRSHIDALSQGGTVDFYLTRNRNV